MKKQDARWREWLHVNLARIGIRTVSNGTKMYGTHSCRGGGALAMTLAGRDVATIKNFGDWKSDSINVYVLDAPVLKHSMVIADSMIRGLYKSLQSTPTFKPGDEVAVFQNSKWIDAIVVEVQIDFLKLQPHCRIRPRAQTQEFWAPLDGSAWVVHRSSS